MKKILTMGLALLLILSLTACGTNGVSNITKTATLEEFDTTGVIEQAVIYDKNNVKITANELVYNTFDAELKLTIENNTNTELTFISGSLGYDVNSVNGYMVDDGYLNCDVPAGQKVDDSIKFDFASLKVYGLTSVADIVVGFNIYGDDYKDVYTGPLAIQTSLAQTYDYTENRYQKILKNGAFENEFNCDVKHFSDEIIYDNYNIVISSTAVINNEDNEPILLLEVNNKTTEDIYVSVNDVYINGTLVDKGICESEHITSGKSYPLAIKLKSLVEYYDGDVASITNISNMDLTVKVGLNWYEEKDSKKISLTLPNIVVPVEVEQE